MNREDKQQTKEEDSGIQIPMLQGFLELFSPQTFEKFFPELAKNLADMKIKANLEQNHLIIDIPNVVEVNCYFRNHKPFYITMLITAWLKDWLKRLKEKEKGEK